MKPKLFFFFFTFIYSDKIGCCTSSSDNQMGFVCVSYYGWLV